MPLLPLPLLPASCGPSRSLTASHLDAADAPVDDHAVAVDGRVGAVAVLVVQLGRPVPTRQRQRHFPTASPGAGPADDRRPFSSSGSMASRATEAEEETRHPPRLVLRHLVGRAALPRLVVGHGGRDGAAAREHVHVPGHLARADDGVEAGAEERVVAPVRVSSCTSPYI